METGTAPVREILERTCTCQAQCRKHTEQEGWGRSVTCCFGKQRTNSFCCGLIFGTIPSSCFTKIPLRRPFGADVPGSWSDDDLRLSWKVSARCWREGAGLRGASCPERAEPGPGDGRAPPAAPWPQSLRPRRVLRHPARLSPPPGGAQLCPARLRAAASPPAPLPELEPRGSRAPSRQEPAVCGSVPRSSEATAYRCLPRPPRVSPWPLEPYWCSWRPHGRSRAPSSRLQTARSSLAGAPAPRLRAALPHRPASSGCQELERGRCTHWRIGGSLSPPAPWETRGPAAGPGFSGVVAECDTPRAQAAEAPRLLRVP
ncbi:hypothetical protein NN561_009084 [Cricetulus griseus]